MKRGHGAAADPASGRPNVYKEMILKRLQALTRANKVNPQKKVSENCVDMRKVELVEALRALDAKKDA